MKLASGQRSGRQNLLHDQPGGEAGACAGAVMSGGCDCHITVRRDASNQRWEEPDTAPLYDCTDMSRSLKSTEPALVLRAYQLALETGCSLREVGEAALKWCLKAKHSP